MTLRLDRVSKTYYRNGSPVLALDNVSLQIRPGEVVAVVGGRGSGKTSLLKAAAGLERPDSGHVEINGQRLDQLSDHGLTSLRRFEIGCLWGPSLPVARATALDLVALPLRMQSGDGRSALAEARKALHAVDAADCAEARLEELSEGERQLVALAQALVTKPRLLLLDQPVSNLRVSDEKAFLNVLRSLAADAEVAILMTAGSATQAMAASTIASISEGRLLTGGGVETSEAAVLNLADRRHSAHGGAKDS